jgi:hypothetical protein
MSAAYGERQKGNRAESFGLGFRFKTLETGAPMNYKTVTVRHSLIEPRNDEAIDEFERLLDEGIHEWANRNKLTAEEVSQQLCKTLLERLQRRATSLITPVALTKIHDPSATSEGAALVESICGEISMLLRLDLICMSGLPLRGRRREFSARDRKICEMRRRGHSYGKIGHTLRISRNEVQAAYRRERQRRELLCRRYPVFRQLLRACGISLRATKVAN